MEPPAYEPTGWVGIVPWLIYFAPFAVPTALIAWGQWKAKAHRQKDKVRHEDDKALLDEVHEQTVNNHKGKDNLRDQVDRLEGTIDRLETVLTDGFAQVQRQLNGVHERIHTESLERIAADNRLSINIVPTPKEA
ncbi:hypothetical protein [Mycolicibacterium septicum]|uniref:hypothetical protein n=1 Tax=Mycolicibacterium septicum TaxID=98668 RepID=UPI001AF0B86B|nr:hypothetical protein [Mycolicibacterium septicum]QRY51718.1 hypothetical protein JVX95_30810 [Mycolicibacterium septicum]